jgi:precorrin-6B methylase 2
MPSPASTAHAPVRRAGHCSDTLKAVSERFQFGQNWLNYLAVVNEERISEATARMSELLGDISGKTFLDIGSGSGIHSLAAVRLGAATVHSFDYDQQSVECTREMKRRFAPESDWNIEQGSALDAEYLRSLGKFDIVYSWGVLHHTGDMWKALGLLLIPAQCVISVCLYEDQGIISRTWRTLKWLYVSHPFTRPTITALSFATIWGPKIVLLPHRAIPDWRNWKRKRGMSPWHDVIDWAGGYPYEFARKDDVLRFYSERGFEPAKVVPFGKIIRMHEYVFTSCIER